MLYLMEVVKDEYKIYDSDSKDIFIKDSEFVENWRVLGVVPLTEESVLAQCFTKLQLDIMKCIKDIKRYKIRYNFGAYPDLGIKELLITSDKKHFENPKTLYKYEKQLAKLQR